AAHQGRPGPGGGRGGDRPRPAAAAARQGPHPPGGVGPALPEDPRAPRRPGHADEARPADPAAVPGPGPGRAGVRGRRLHPRRGLARRVGGPVPDDERTATADRVDLARHHGQRPGAGHRRPVRPPRPAGRGHGRRRRPGDADGRAAHRGAAPPGDGGLAMLMGELLTVVQHRLPVKVVVHNNSSLNFIDLEMKAAGFPPYGTELVNPDFAQVAEAMGLTGIRVTESADLPNAVREAFDHPGPVLLDVVTYQLV